MINLAMYYTIRKVNVYLEILRCRIIPTFRLFDVVKFNTLNTLLSC